MTKLINLIRVDSLRSGQRVASVAGAPSLEGSTLQADAPQETWLLGTNEGRALAHGSIWWHDTPKLDGRRVGAIGHFAAEEAASAERLLGHLCARLTAEGCCIAVGPMDGNTWRKYRLVVWRGIEPPFFLDVDNTDELPDYFRAAGFQPISAYYSTVVEDIAVEDPRVKRVAERLGRLGVRIRSLDPARMEDELRAIHHLSLLAFQNAFLYSPIAEGDFLAIYRPMLPRVDPRLVLIAEHAGRVVGYMFSVPNLSEASRGEPLRSLVVKTAAVMPDRAYGGLGALLLAQVHRRAVDLGLTRAVHALMHASNASRALSGHWQAREIRRYELFARDLAP
jgi:hypothetical protein